MTTRLSLLLMAVLWTSTLVSAQEASSTSAALARGYGTVQRSQKYRPISAVPIRDPRVFFRASGPMDQSLLWRVHLALQLVKQPRMNQQQVRIVLDAISLASPEFFSARDTPARKRKADEALQSLTRRALRAFADNQAAQLFAKLGGEKTEDDILAMYFDISALPLKKRKASFRNASSKDKSDLWRTHLALKLVTSPALNERQTEIILVAMNLATPTHFEVPSSDPDWQAKVRGPLRELEERIANAFSREEAAKIFATLGEDTELAKSNAVVFRNINYKPLRDSLPLTEWSYNRLQDQGMAVEQQGPCDCQTTSNYCPIWKSNCSGGNCSWAQDGCGTLWNYPCNGVCR